MSDTKNNYNKADSIMNILAYLKFIPNHILPIIICIIAVVVIIYSYIGHHRDLILMKPLVRGISIGFLIKTVLLIILLIVTKTTSTRYSFYINLLFFGFMMIYSIYYFLHDVGDSVSETIIRDVMYLLAIIILISISQFHSGGNILLSFLTQIIMIVFLGGYALYKLPSYCQDIQHPKEGFTIASILSYLPLLIIFIIWYENKFYCINSKGIFKSIPVENVIGNTWIYTVIYYLILLGLYFGYMFITKKVGEQEDWQTFLTDSDTWINTNSLLLLIPFFFPSFLYSTKFQKPHLLYAQLILMAVVIFSLILGNNIKLFF